MRYDVGDRVQIRHFNDLSREYCTNNVLGFLVRKGFNNEMAKFMGKVVTISGYDEYADAYTIEEDGGRWSWSDDMIYDETMISERKYNGDRRRARMATLFRRDTQ